MGLCGWVGISARVSSRKGGGGGGWCGSSLGVEVGARQGVGRGAGGDRYMWVCPCIQTINICIYI